MRSTPAISVIVPFADAEVHLPRALATLARQTCPEFEAVFIDDASVDGGPGLIRAAAARDPRIQLLTTRRTAGDRRRGPAAARNVGLARARGEFLFFLDADDTLPPDAFARLLEAIAPEDDALIADFSRPDGAVDRRGDDWFYDASRRFAGPETLRALTDYLDRPRGASAFTNVWGRLFRRSVAARHGLVFDESLLTYEDNAFNLDFFGCARSWGYLRARLYDYHVHAGAPGGGSAVFSMPLGFRVIPDHARRALARRGAGAAEIKRRLGRATAYLAVRSVLGAYALRQRDGTAGMRLAGWVGRIARDASVRAALRCFPPRRGENAWVPLLLSRGRADLVDRHARRLFRVPESRP